MGQSKHILIVDDEPQVISLLRAILEAENFDVSAARDGDELRDALAERSFDLITLDLGVPGFSGVELARDLCRTTDTPVIVVSGRNDEFDRVIALELGVDDYIGKPFNTRELAARPRACGFAPGRGWAAHHACYACAYRQFSSLYVEHPNSQAQ